MSRPRTPGKPEPLLRELAAGDTFSIAGLRGTTVRALQGRVWVTQAGDTRDYVVPAGGRFCAAGEGHLVISALTDATQIAIYRSEIEPPGDWLHNAVHLDPDFAETARRAARQEAAQWFGCMLMRGWRWLQRAWSRRSAPSARSTHGYHC